MKRVLYSVVLAVALTLSAVVAQPVWADGESQGGSSKESQLCIDYKNDPELYEAAGCGKTTTASDFVNNLLTVVLSLVGLVGIGVMIYGGITYATSAGDAAKAQRAKHIVMYGIIGLAVALLAYAIVFFVTKAINRVA